MDDLINLARQAGKMWEGTDAYHQAAILINALCDRIEILSAADVEPVVRCKDCRHLYFKDMSAYCPHSVSACHPDGFCNYGERRDDDMAD